VHSLTYYWGSDHRWLRRYQEIVRFISLGCEVASICQKGIKVDHTLINEHAGNAACKLLSEDLLNNAIDSIANEGLSLLRICHGCQIKDIYRW
jgi:hypothetical protein